MSKSTSKVTPDEAQGPETIIDTEEKDNKSKRKLRSNMSISFASDVNRSVEFPSDNISGQSSPAKEKTVDSKTLDSSKPLPTTSQRKRDYNASRVKSSESFFTTRSDVFEIDDHVERLSNQLQKSYRSKSRKTNTWNTKKSPLKRFFMCSLFRAPRMFSSDEICMYAKVGDLLLFREGTSFEHRYLSPEVMRGIKSSLDGKYIPKTRQIKMWNHVGIVVSLYDEETTEYVKFLMYADDIGLRLRKLAEVTNSCVIAQDLCSLRPIQIKNSKQQQLYSQFVDDIESVALLAMDGKLLWSNFQQAERFKNEDWTTLDKDIVMILENPFVSRFHTLFTQRMHDLSFSPSLEGIQEATRLFYSMMAVYQQNEKVEQENSNSFQKMDSFGKAENTKQLPLTMIFKSLSVMNEDAGESKQSDHEFSMRLSTMLQGMDDDKDGLVSLVG